VEFGAYDLKHLSNMHSLWTADKWDQCTERQQDQVGEDDGAKREPAEPHARKIVYVELLLIVLCEEVLGWSVPEHTLSPRDLFHRDATRPDTSEAGEHQKKTPRRGSHAIQIQCFTIALKG